LVSVVVTLAPKSTVPPLPPTQSVLSAIERTGLVTDGVDGDEGVDGEDDEVPEEVDDDEVGSI
jgi:hypothetical protein